MKKKILILSSLIMFALIVSMVTLFYGDSDKAIFESGKNNTVVRSNALTMMYETEAGSGEYAVSSDTVWPQEGYVFNERLSSCENGGILSWNSETKRVVMKTNTSDKCYVYFDVYEPTFAEYIINNVYVEDGVNGLYYHDGLGNYENADQEADDYSYRYSGEDPNNYVCFGSDVTPCPNDNLYRIIGIFGDQVKLIKSTSIGDYAWDSGNSNTWDASTKPDIYTTLNVTYYNTLESEWQNKIANVTWKVGGVTWNRTYIAKDYYDLEVGSGQTGYVETMKIGLMYASDYGYAADPSCWTKSLSSNGYGLDNWLYLSNYAWLISPSSSSDSYGSAYNTGSSFGEGGLSTSYVVSTDAVYPTFYLLSSITLSSGTGTESAPFRIA
mgnify:FL=1